MRTSEAGGPRSSQQGKPGRMLVSSRCRSTGMFALNLRVFIHPTSIMAIKLDSAYTGLTYITSPTEMIAVWVMWRENWEEVVAVSAAYLGSEVMLEGVVNDCLIHDSGTKTGGVFPPINASNFQ
jgi:hypothetical protein